MGRPACAQACEVSPEQSNDAGPSAPHTYGLPSCAAAYVTAAPPAAVGVRTATPGRPAAGPGEPGAPGLSASPPEPPSARPEPPEPSEPSGSPPLPGPPGSPGPLVRPEPVGLPRRPEASSARWASASSARSRAASRDSCSAVRVASSFCTSPSCRTTSSRCFFCRVTSNCWESRALRASVASASACFSAPASRASTAARCRASRPASRPWSKACPGSPESSIRAYGEKPPAPWYCSRASRPACARSMPRTLRALPRAPPSRRSSAARAFSAAAVPL